MADCGSAMEWNETMNVTYDSGELGKRFQRLMELGR